MKIYKAVLQPITQSELDKVLRGSSLEDRIQPCPDCGGEEFWLYPEESVAVRTGGKPYCECTKCGYITHL
jgi:DNA-directed RNA polymerase subunit M/transcription elongation factor TFIIS